ncbi:MAG: hypothetical protein Q4F57_06625 [Weeksellaceae bacterium]|nr:hypothetical protein [Weeksellaceae bacterium]
MKSLIYFSIILSVSVGTLSAQVAIEKTTLTNDAVILEFNDIRTGGPSKGLRLPLVIGEPSNAVDGTLIFDTETGVFKLLKSTGWEVLSEANLAVQAPTAEETAEENGVILGQTLNAPPGALVLNDTTKAMILPHVENVETAIDNPAPGTMVYDRSRKAIAFYNGVEWELRYGN